MERYLPHFTEEVLKRISAATYVAMFAEWVTRYCVILEKGCTMAGIGGCTLLSLMYSW